MPDQTRLPVLGPPERRAFARLGWADRAAAAPRAATGRLRPHARTTPRLAWPMQDRDLTPIVAIAPLRISFVGGGTDFPHWFRDHHGAVLSATIDHFVRVEITPRLARPGTRAPGPR